MKLKRILSLMLALIIINTSFAFASDDDNSFELDAGAGIMIDLGSGEILYEKNAYDKMYPASITKIMTAILVLENLEMDDVVTITQADINEVYPYITGYGLYVGEEFLVEDLLYLLLIASSNDAAVALARTVAGSYSEFTVMMNEKAKELGAMDTNFVNAHGLHEDEHYTTAYDITLIAREALTYDFFASTVTYAQKTISATNKSDERIIYTTNKMIFRASDPEYDTRNYGIKTGFTNPAGNCFVGLQKQDGLEFLTVVLNAETDSVTGIAKSFTETTRMSDWGFSNFEIQTLIAKNNNLTEMNVSLSQERDNVVLTTTGEISAMLPIDFDINDVEYVIDIPEEVMAPIEAGTVYGTVEVIYEGESYGQVELMSIQSASRSEVLYNVYLLENFFKTDTFKLILVAVILVIILLIIFKIIRSRRKRRERYRRVHRDTRSAYRNRR